MRLSLVAGLLEILVVGGALPTLYLAVILTKFLSVHLDKGFASPFDLLVKFPLSVDYFIEVMTEVPTPNVVF